MNKEEFNQKMKVIKKRKEEILSEIFISKEEVELYKNTKELHLLLEIVELQNRLENVVVILGDILRKKDIGNNNKLLQEVFEEFYKVIDKECIVKLKKKRDYYINKVTQLEKQLTKKIE